MSTWNLGANDVTEEEQNIKNKLASKDGHIAALQSKLMKQVAEYDELKITLNETLHKLSNESVRALRLEKDLRQCSEDLRNEKNTSQNVETALGAAKEEIKKKDLEARDLQATLESISYRSDGFSSNCSKLEREKRVLEARVQELQVNLHQITTATTTTPGRRLASRPRSSSLSNLRISGLEGDLEDLRLSLATKENDLRVANEKLARTQGECIKSDNEKISLERQMKARLGEMEAALEEKEAELEFLRGQLGDGGTNGREDDLLERIEEDEAKIAALEKMLHDNRDLASAQDKLKKMESRLQAERKKVQESELREIELVREKEEAYDELEDVRSERERLAGVVRAREAEIAALQARESEDEGRTIVMPEARRQRSSSEVTVAHVERLLVAIQRLREERDSLRHDLEFVEMESKFSAAALQLQENKQHCRADQPNQSAIQKRLKHLTLAATASFIAVGHLQSQAEAQNTIQLQASDFIAQLRGHLAERQEELNSVMYVGAQTVADEVAEHDAQPCPAFSFQEHSQDEVEALRALYRNAQEALEQAEARMADVGKSLETVESERDSLALQLTHMEAELLKAQEELSDAHSRYGKLQAHQLSSMTTSDAVAALRDEIEGLEHRVMRRTEQIGIHQHDIKRLETNLKLSEERVVEMTAELETVGEEKAAMVEDCAAAREARDEAIQRVEELEVELETFEGRLDEEAEAKMRVQAEAEVMRGELVSRDQDVVNLVAVIAETIAGCRKAIRVSQDSNLDGLKSKGDENDVARQISVDHERIHEHNSRQQELELLTTDIRQAILALAVSRVEVKQHVERIITMESSTAALREQLSALKRQHEIEIAVSRSKIEASAHKEADLNLHATELEKKLLDAERRKAELEAQHQDVLQKINTSKQDLERRLLESQQLVMAKDTESEIELLQGQHAEAIRALQSRLDCTESELQQARISYKALEEVREDLDLNKQQLNEQLASVSAAREEIEKELELVKLTSAKQIEDLQMQFNMAVTQTQEAQSIREELESLRSRSAEDLARADEEYQARMAEATESSNAVTQQLELQIAGLHSILDKQSVIIKNYAQEVSELSSNLLEETKAREHDRDEREEERTKLAERCKLVESERGDLLNNFQIVEAKLGEATSILRSLEEEKVSLQTELTKLQAQLQRSISLHRHLESQVADSERKVKAAETDLERTRAELRHLEQTAKAAEVNHVLESTQHKRTVSSLERQIDSLRSRPNYEELVAQLESKNNEMEELLKSKCVEIEENDDRVIDMLKEKKKLTNKIESLTRKVQILQAKLAAPKGPAPVISSPPIPSQSVAEPSSIPQVPQVPSVPFRQRSMTTSSAAQGRVHKTPVSMSQSRSSRVVTGPTSLPRSKTPERRTQPVFKARTPEQPSIPVIPDSQPSPSSSKKRRAPDDFEDGSAIPTQPFTVESLPVESTTPRIRRVPSNNFTPIRRHNSRPVAALPSPKVAVPETVGSSPFISDVTNSPRTNRAINGEMKPMKRSWLGKLRGAPTQTSSRLVSTHRPPVFERAPLGYDGAVA